MFKIGKWNPDVVVIDHELAKFGVDNKLDTSCCPRCSNKDVHRAALTGNIHLLKACMQDKFNVTNLNAPWSCEVNITPLDLLLMKSDLDMISEFLKPNFVKAGRGQTYE